MLNDANIFLSGVCKKIKLSLLNPVLAGKEHYLNKLVLVFIHLLTSKQTILLVRGNLLVRQNQRSIAT